MPDESGVLKPSLIRTTIVIETDLWKQVRYAAIAKKTTASRLSVFAWLTT